MHVAHFDHAEGRHTDGTLPKESIALPWYIHYPSCVPALDYIGMEVSGV